MTKRQGIMLCNPLEERRLPETGWVNSWNSWPVIVQPKLDGERCRAVWTLENLPEEMVFLLSSEMNFFDSVPHIIEAVTDQIPNHIELDGELYIHGMEFPDIHSIVSRTVNLHPDYKSMEYHVFDVIDKDAQHRRLTSLNALNLKPPLRIVDCYVCFSLDEIMKCYDSILEEGYEGIIVRNIDNYYERKRSVDLMKFKPKKSDYYKIVGWKEEVSIHGEPKNRLGSLLCVGRDETTFSVGSGFTDDERQALWTLRETLKGKIAHVKYQSIRPSGKPNFATFDAKVGVVDAEPEEANFLLNL